MRIAIAFFILATTVAAPPALASRTECLIEPWKVVRVGARSTGVLSNLLIDRGDQVQAGQEIAQLNSEIESASLLLAKERAASRISIDLAEARQNFEALNLERSQQLSERQVLSQQELDTAIATYEISRLQVLEAESAHKIAGLELERTRAIHDRRMVRSPIDGIVLSIDRARGEFLSENDNVATIAQIDPLRVQAFLPLNLIDEAKVGRTVRIFPQEPIGGTYSAKIDVVDRVIDARSGTVGIRAILENRDLETLAGLRCELEFVEGP